MRGLGHPKCWNMKTKYSQPGKAAEDEFREQFLAKLQENMKQAQNEFKELNKR